MLRVREVVGKETNGAGRLAAGSRSGDRKEDEGGKGGKFGEHAVNEARLVFGGA